MATKRERADALMDSIAHALYFELLTLVDLDEESGPGLALTPKGRKWIDAIPPDVISLLVVFRAHEKLWQLPRVPSGRPIQRGTGGKPRRSRHKAR